MKCKICGGASNEAFIRKVLGKFDVAYFRCGTCGFIQTETPYWLEESYSSAIADVDIGPVNRALSGADTVENLVLRHLDPNARYIDWGGGYGLFTRLMRDRGYDFYWKDIYCANLFARGFEATAGERYELLTAFEVFEHLVDPLPEIEQMLGYSGNIFLTTLPVPEPMPADWWYLSPETGQHISLYTMAALEVVAKRFGLQLSSDGQVHHFLGRKRITPGEFRRLVRNGRAVRLLRRLLRRRHAKRSLLQDDFRALSGWNV